MFEWFVIQAIHACFGIKESDTTQVNVFYTKEKVNGWCNSILDNAIRNLNKLEKPFKYALTCVIQQNNGAGLVTTGTFENSHNLGCGYYDYNTDGIVGVQKEIKDIIVVMSVYACFI